MSAPVTTLTGNGATDAFDLSAIASDPCFTISGATGGAISVQYSNKRGTKTAADWLTDPTPISTFPAGPLELPFGIAKFVRFVGITVTGVASVLWGPAKSSRGDLVDVGTEPVTMINT